MLNSNSYNGIITYGTYIILQPGTYNDISIFLHYNYLGVSGSSGGHTGIFQITNGQDGSGPVIYTSQEPVHFYYEYM